MTAAGETERKKREDEQGALHVGRINHGTQLWLRRCGCCGAPPSLREGWGGHFVPCLCFQRAAFFHLGEQLVDMVVFFEHLQTMLDIFTGDDFDFG